MSSWLPIPYKVVILGGGLSGLSAAHSLLKHSKIPCDITIVEQQQRIGGWLESTRYEDGTVFEHGPRSARSYGTVALQALNILSELDINEKIVGIPKTHDAAKRRYIYANKKVHELPSSLTSVMFRQDPFSKSLMSSLIREPFVKKSMLEDESVFSFFERRFNKEVFVTFSRKKGTSQHVDVKDQIATYLSDPLCRGIFGGNAKELSLKSCFPILFDYERQHGSVIKGMLFSKTEKRSYDSELIERAKSDKWMAWTMKGGIQTLPEIWSQYLKNKGVKFQLDTTCKTIDFVPQENTVICKTNHGSLEANHVISTLPSVSLSSIVTQADNRLSTLLNSVKYANMAVITMEYDSVKVPHNGFGILVPSCEPCDILGITFDSQIFPHLTKKNSTIITAMSGGAWYHELHGDPHNADISKITEIAIKSSRDILGIRESPSRTLCKIQQNCIPQYEVGHHQRSEMIQNHVKANNLPMTLIGNTWGGVGVNDVIVNAHNDVLKWLASMTMY